MPRFSFFLKLESYFFYKKLRIGYFFFKSKFQTKCAMILPFNIVPNFTYFLALVKPNRVKTRLRRGPLGRGRAFLLAASLELKNT